MNKKIPNRDKSLDDKEKKIAKRREMYRQNWLRCEK